MQYLGMRSSVAPLASWSLVRRPLTPVHAHTHLLSSLLPPLAICKVGGKMLKELPLDFFIKRKNKGEAAIFLNGENKGTRSEV